MKRGYEKLVQWSPRSPIEVPWEFYVNRRRLIQEFLCWNGPINRSPGDPIAMPRCAPDWGPDIRFVSEGCDPAGICRYGIRLGFWITVGGKAFNSYAFTIDDGPLRYGTTLMSWLVAGPSLAFLFPYSCRAEGRIAIGRDESDNFIESCFANQSRKLFVMSSSRRVQPTRKSRRFSVSLTRQIFCCALCRCRKNRMRPRAVLPLPSMGVKV